MARTIRALAKRLISLPLWLGTSNMKRGPHVTRYRMYQSLQETTRDLPRNGGTALSISHSTNLLDLIGVTNVAVTEANFPEYTAVDLSRFPSDAFDYVVSDQVLEHVEGNPQDVFDETRRLLKPGGIAIHTTCLINPVHGFPSDYWRFTVNGLRYLARDFSEIISAEGFGNRGVWLVEFLGLRFNPVPHATWHPLHKIATKNNPSWPVSTWIIARK
jgi:SAM-dependent methyltransferase